jgi:saccharopine dehydrogenase-like NADP-dependent oxidoreductase
MDLLAHLMVKKMQYHQDERDMIILEHQFEVEEESGRKIKAVSSLVEFGHPQGDSAMSRLVGLPAAIATQLLLEERVQLTGVQIPVKAEVYQPILNHLEKMGISFKKKTVEFPESQNSS